MTGLTDWEEFYRGHFQFDTRYLLIKVLFHQHEELFRMGALEDALASEENVIQQVVTLVQGLSGVQAQLNTVQAALDALTVVDAQDKADLQAAIDAAQLATGTVQSQTAELQALVPPAEPTPAAE